MEHTFDHTITLEKVDAARERRLIDGERALEPHVGFASARDGREKTELSHPQPLGRRISSYN